MYSKEHSWNSFFFLVKTPAENKGDTTLFFFLGKLNYPAQKALAAPFCQVYN